MLLGRWLEGRAKGRHHRRDPAAASRSRRRPPGASAAGSRTDVELADVVPGDLLRVRPGRQGAGRRRRRRGRVARSTSRCSPASRSRSTSGPGDEVIGAHAQHDRLVRHARDAGRPRHGARADRRPRPARPGLARRRSSAWPTGSRGVRARSCWSSRPSTFVVVVRVGPGAAADARAHRVHRGRDHRLPVRDGPRDADRDHGRHGPRRRGRDPRPGRRGARGGAAGSTPSSSTRRARSPWAGPSVDGVVPGRRRRRARRARPRGLAGARQRASARRGDRRGAPASDELGLPAPSTVRGDRRPRRRGRGRTGDRSASWSAAGGCWPSARRRRSRRSATPASGRRATAGRRSCVAVDGRVAGLLAIADPVKAGAGRGGPRRCASAGHRGLAADRRRAARPPRPSRRRSASPRTACSRTCCPTTRPRDRAPPGRGPRRRDGRRRDQRRAGARPRPTSASRSAPARTWRSRRPT